MADHQYLTFRFRIKDAVAAKHLRRMSLAVNTTWNYCSGAQDHARKWNTRWPNVVSLCKGLAGCGAELGIGSDTFQAVAKQWCVSRDKAKRRPRWRVSHGARRSLGWVPFMAARAIRIDGDTIRFNGRRFRFWKHRKIPADIRSGSFSEDASGRWYLNLVCRVDADRPRGAGEVGIDLGLKDLATLSTGEMIANPRHLRKSAKKLATAQRAGRKKRARAINRKIAAQRRDYLHKASARIAAENRLVVVGDVNASALAKMRMAKSVLDAGWSSFRSMLRYKLALRHGAIFVETNERFSTQTCNCCGARTGPRGVEGLSVRIWDCQSCGSSHDRDRNAALNILASGRSAALLTESRRV